MYLRSAGHRLLIEKPVPGLLPEQVARFNEKSLRARSTRQFDPRLAQGALVESAPRKILAIDVGGDKLIAALYRIRDGALDQECADVVRRGEDGGRGYVDFLVKLADNARRNLYPVGISFAGLVEGTRLVEAPNLPAEFCDLLDCHDRDLAKLFPSVEVVNDAEAGIMAASVEAIKCHPKTQHVIYVINGSGLGGAVLTNSSIFACEPGHIEADRRLNPFQTRQPCGVLGETYVCLERIAASRAGIEDIWLQRRREPNSGRDIAQSYMSGDRLALDLYDNSARVTAHVVWGLTRAFGLPLDQTAVVAHGGTFHVPGYDERLCSILDRSGFSPLHALFPRDFSANPCLDGAAIAAVLKAAEVTPTVPTRLSPPRRPIV